MQITVYQPIIHYRPLRLTEADLAAEEPWEQQPDEGEEQTLLLPEEVHWSVLGNVRVWRDGKVQRIFFGPDSSPSWLAEVELGKVEEEGRPFTECAVLCTNYKLAEPEQPASAYIRSADWMRDEDDCCAILPDGHAVRIGDIWDALATISRAARRLEGSRNSPPSAPGPV